MPEAGDRLEVVPDERTARAIFQKRQEEAQAKRQESTLRRPLSLDDISAQIREGQIKELNILLKTDVQGSIEPIVNSLKQLDVGDVKVNIIHAAAGGITESDVNLAVASTGIILGFRVDINSAANHMADTEGIDIKRFQDILPG